MTHPDFYAFLGIPRNATSEQIADAFRDKARALQPGKGRSEEEAARELHLLTQAYQTLRDPLRRQQYDATLPPLPQPGKITDIGQLWRATATVFLDRAQRYTPAVDALRATTPLILEGEEMLIVGTDPAHAELIRYLSSSDTHNQVRKIISELYGKPLDFRVISGSTLQDWLTLKEGQRRIEQKRQAAAQARGDSPAAAPEPAIAPQPSAVDVEEIWETVMEALVGQWSAADSRAFPQVRGRFILDQLAGIARAEDGSRAAGAPEETIQRNIAKVLERLDSLTGVESGVIALEYLRLRGRTGEPW